MGLISKTISYTLISALAFYSGCRAERWNLGRRAVSEKPRISFEGNLLGEPTISDSNTNKKYILDFQNSRLEEVTDETYKTKEREKLIGLFK